MRIVPQTECEGCGKQIGHDDYLIAWDGITSKTVAFHSKCNPSDPDLQRHHNVTLEPVNMNLFTRGIG